jgi:hypothetical protein
MGSCVCSWVPGTYWFREKKSGFFVKNQTAA